MIVLSTNVKTAVLIKGMLSFVLKANETNDASVDVVTSVVPRHELSKMMENRENINLNGLNFIKT